MSDSRQKLAVIGAPPLAKMFLSMAACLLAAALGAFCLLTKSTAEAVFLGGLIAILGHAYFAWQAFRYRGAANARRIVSAFARGERGKFTVVALGFAAVWLLNPQIEALTLLLSFAGFYLLYSFFSYRYIR